MLYVDHLHLRAGKHVARGEASKAFHPFMSPKDLKDSSEDLESRLMVNFDPLKCFIGGLEASNRVSFLPGFQSLAHVFPNLFLFLY